jgi:MFS family permease
LPSSASGFRLLFLASLASGIGTYLAFVALTLDVWDRTESGRWVSALLVADLLPTIAIGLFFGSVVDRFSRRRLLIAADLVRFAVFCALPFATSAGQIVVLAAITGFATGFFRPAVYAGLPNLVTDAQLPRANSLLQAVENLTLTIGPLAGGLLVAASSPDVAYWINAATFLVSAAFLARIPHMLMQAGADASEGRIRDLLAGFRLVRRSRALATVLVAWGMATFATGATNVAEVALVKDSFTAGDFGFGLLVAAAGAGLVAGSVLAGPLLERRGTAEVYGGSLALMAFGLGAAALSPNVWVAAACVVVSGAGNGAAIVCNALLVQRGVPDALRGRAFTLLMSLTFSSHVVGMLVAGPMTDAYGARWVWGVFALACGAAALVGLLLARGVREPLGRVRLASPEVEAAGRPTEGAV